MFIAEKPFSVIQCDKNIGLAIISNNLLHELCTQHLSYNKTYLKLDSNPLKECCLQIKAKLDVLIKDKQLNIKLARLVPSNPKLGKFRLLAKLHKNNFDVRPIINNNKHLTSKLCKLIDLIIQPILRSTETYIKDSQHLLQKCEKLIIKNQNVFLYSMDFKALYTNVNKLHTVQLITEYIGMHLDSMYITPLAFNVILSKIFDYNIFAYKSNGVNKIQYYKQINGLAMGCICGPTIASLFVYILEKKWLMIHKPLFYVRFIDDINLISYTKLDENDFKSYFLNLELNLIEV